MNPRLKWALLTVGTIAAIALVFTGAQRVIERQQTLDEINSLRDELYRARAAADRCRGSLETSEMALRDLGVAIDSLRQEVRRYEGLDVRGVPGDQYDAYLATFDSYNDSVAAWEGRERRLRSAETACRGTIESHNAISDSLQAVLEAAGIPTD